MGNRSESPHQLIALIQSQMGSESIRSVASRAGISHGHLSDFLNGKVTFKASTLKKLAEAIGIAPARLLHLAGYLDEIPTDDLDQRAAHLAARITDLVPPTRSLALTALESQLDAIVAAARPPLSEETARHLQGIINDLMTTINHIQQMAVTALEVYGEADESLLSPEQQTPPLSVTESLDGFSKTAVEKILNEARAALVRAQQQIDALSK